VPMRLTASSYVQQRDGCVLGAGIQLRPPLWTLGADDGTISTATMSPSVLGPLRRAGSAVMAENSALTAVSTR